MLPHTNQIRIDPPYLDRLRACGLATVEEALACQRGRVCAWSRSTDTIHVPGPPGELGFYLKRYFYPSWTRRLRGAFRGTFFGEHRAASEQRLLNEMRLLGIPAVRPVAYGARRLGHFVTACFLITEEVPESLNLTTFAAEVAAGRIHLSAGQRRQIVASLARHVAEVHGASFSHGQLFWRNILIRIGPAGDGEFFFLDARPRRAGRRRHRRTDWWLEELAHLTASARPFTTRSERLRFLSEYYGSRRLLPDVRKQIRLIERLAQKWSKHEAQRIRMSERFEAWNRRLIAERPQPVEAQA